MATLHPWKRRVFIDTEFSNLEAPVLVSIAMVAEDGAEFYAETNDFSISGCSEFVRTFVVPQLGQYPDRSMSSHEASNQLCNWMEKLKTSRQRPVICYDHPVDVQLLTRLIGRKPVGWQLENISTRLDVGRREQYFALHGGRHHALHDARANRAAYR
jgi:hypothetical protein